MKYQETCVAGRWSEMVKEEQPSEKALDRGGVNTLPALELIGLILGSCGSDYSVENALLSTTLQNDNVTTYDEGSRPAVRR